jgi:hypothetical protein
MIMYIVCKSMDIYGYPNIWWVWIWSNIHAHGYFYGRGKVRPIDLDLDLDLVLQYPSKPAPLPSLVTRRVLLRSGFVTTRLLMIATHCRKCKCSFCGGFIVINS